MSSAQLKVDLQVDPLVQRDPEVAKGPFGCVNGGSLQRDIGTDCIVRRHGRERRAILHWFNGGKGACSLCGAIRCRARNSNHERIWSLHFSGSQWNVDMVMSVDSDAAIVGTAFKRPALRVHASYRGLILTVAAQARPRSLKSNKDLFDTWRGTPHQI